ncbi:MAG: DUF5615 family PIN-like protein [Deltaproteobacteria bacterium]|nr:DUF5615 family PIN-like protein [Deltaproteobacteria bacterium]
MPEALRVLLDQNVSREIAPWLRALRPSWVVNHVSEVGLLGADDADIFDWAVANGALIVTFDEDFADQRSFPVGSHHGVMRLRVWPTTVEETQSALARLLRDVADEELAGALVIVDRLRIRVRRPRI